VSECECRPFNVYRDKNLLVPCSKRVKTAQHRTLGSHCRMEENRKFSNRINTLSDLRDRRVTVTPVTDGFDPHMLPPFNFKMVRLVLNQSWNET